MSNREAQLLAALGENKNSDPKSVNLLIEDENSGSREEEDIDHDHPIDPTATKPLEVKEQLTQWMGQ